MSFREIDDALWKSIDPSSLKEISKGKLRVDLRKLTNWILHVVIKEEKVRSTRWRVHTKNCKREEWYWIMHNKNSKRLKVITGEYTLKM